MATHTRACLLTFTAAHTLCALLQQQGQHPLRERAKKLDQGILVIRFEMPFNVWCKGCGHLIGKGVRFNAEKQAIGNYHSTKVWSFSMTAPCCQQRIVVHTDPKSSEYLVVSGGRRKVQPELCVLWGGLEAAACVRGWREAAFTPKMLPPEKLCLAPYA